MSIRFLADEDLRTDIIDGLRSREPAIDILNIKTAGWRGATDLHLLGLAAQQGRIIVSHDRKTMTHHFGQRLREGDSLPGLFIVPQDPIVVGRVVESLLLIWAASDPDEWRDRIVYLPFK